MNPSAPTPTLGSSPGPDDASSPGTTTDRPARTRLRGLWLVLGPVLLLVAGTLLHVAGVFANRALDHRTTADLSLTGTDASVRVTLTDADHQVLWGPRNTDAMCRVRPEGAGALPVPVSRVRNPRERRHVGTIQHANFIFATPAERRVVVACYRFNRRGDEVWSVGPNPQAGDDVWARTLKGVGNAVVLGGLAWLAWAAVAGWRRRRATPAAEPTSAN